MKPSVSQMTPTRVRRRPAVCLAIGVSAILFSVSAATRAQESNRAAQALSTALVPVTCSNAAEVARLYELYEKSLGTSKPLAALVAKAAQRLAVCLPIEVSKTKAACPVQCPADGVSIAFLGAGATSPRDMVQATHSLSLFARDAYRSGSPEIQALAAKYKVTEASALLEQRAFVIKRASVTDSDEKRSQELRKKPKESLTQEERDLLERTRGWDDSL